MGDVARAFADRSDRLDAVRKDLVGQHGGYLRSRSSAKIRNLVVEGSRATFEVPEATELFFAERADDTPESTAYWVDHRIEAHKVNGRWALATVAYLPENSYSTPVTLFEDDLPVEMRWKGPRPSLPEPIGEPDLKAVGSGDIVIQASYNYTAMVNYARQWAYGNNPRTRCTGTPTAPISSPRQCVPAGGLPSAVARGTSSSTAATTASGGMATPQASAATRGERRRTGTSSQTRTRDEPTSCRRSTLGIGDVLTWDHNHNGNKNHAQVCTAYNGGNPLMTQHSPSYRDRPMSEILQNADNVYAWKYPHRT